MSVAEDVEELEHSYISGGNGKWDGLFGKQSGSCSEVRHSVPHDPAIPIPGVYPRELKTCLHKNVCTNVHRNIVYSSLEAETAPPTGEWVTTFGLTRGSEADQRDASLHTAPPPRSGLCYGDQVYFSYYLDSKAHVFPW